MSEFQNPQLEDERARQQKRSAMQPLWIGVMLIVGIYIGTNLKDGNVFQSAAPVTNENPNKLVNIINYIEDNYVDSVQKKELIEVAINAMLEKLDPHSYYISPEEFAAMQEPLEGNFEGIGVEFMIQRDTLVVVTPIQGGPSEAAGIQPGDHIVKVNGEVIAGVDISNQRVMELLKGPKGTEVVLGIDRRGKADLIDFTIIRDRIPIESVVAAFLVDEQTGYLKVTRFAKTTFDEFVAAVDGLQQKGAERLILDLRGNGGGYLNTAIPMVESFLKRGQLIVYTEGMHSPRREYTASRDGKYQDMELVVLINQGSASASEILAGALQDHDRAVTVGRRSFGKGLVQDEIDLRDQSALRLTVARYYTPSGRCIQRAYGEGIDYEQELDERYTRGELLSADSIQFSDSLKYSTANGRVVYGGGGIMPDVFVPLDTAGTSLYFSELSYLGIFRQFGFDYVSRNESKLSFRDVNEFLAQFEVDDATLNALVRYAESEGVARQQYGIQHSGKMMRQRLKAFIGRHLFDENAFYRVLLEDDPDFVEGMRSFSRPELLVRQDSNK